MKKCIRILGEGGGWIQSQTKHKVFENACVNLSMKLPQGQFL